MKQLTQSFLHAPEIGKPFVLATGAGPCRVTAVGNHGEGEIIIAVVCTPKGGGIQPRTFVAVRDLTSLPIGWEAVGATWFGGELLHVFQWMNYGEEPTL